MLSVTDVRQFYLGVQGENEEQTITVDVKPWLASYPNGVVSIYHKRNGESVPTPTGAVFDADAGTITWTPTYTDTYVAGEGEAEIRLYENGVIKKTRIVKTGVAPSVTGAAGVTLESGWQGMINYIDDVVEDAIEAADDAGDAADEAGDAQTAAEAAQAAAEDAQRDAETAKGAAETAQGKAEDAQEAAEAAQAAAESAMMHYPYVDPTTGNWMLWDPETGAFVNTGIHAQGPTGTVPDIQIGTVTTLLPDQPATVTRRSGSPDEEPIFDFGIPKGDTGTAENIYGNTIDMSALDSTKVSAAIGAKADKDTDVVQGNFAQFDSNGNPVDSGHKHSDYLTQHQDISGKADKVSGATTGNIATLDENGNLTDGGHAPSYYLPTANVYEGTDKTTAGYALDARTGNTLNTSISNIRKGTAFQAKLSSGNWILNSGENAVAGNYIWKNGVLGQATDAITGGSTAIVENTNWTKCPAKGALSQMSAAGIEKSFTIPANGWSNSSPYTYTWTDADVTAGCTISFRFQDGGPTGEVPYLDAEKVSGGVQFTAPTLPTSGIPVIVKITNVQAAAITSVSGDDVSTSEITGAANVDEALDVLDGRVSTNTTNITYETTISNCNDATDPGTYFVSANASNSPSTAAGRLIVMKGSGSAWGTQIFAGNDNYPNIFVRSKKSSGFSDWDCLALDSKLTIKSVASAAAAYALQDDMRRWTALVDSTATDIPSAQAWFVESIKYSDRYGVQIATRDGADEMYIRRLNSGTWSSWVQLATLLDSFALGVNFARSWGGSSLTIKIPNGGGKGQYRTYILNVVYANDGVVAQYSVGTQNATTPYLHKIFSTTGVDVVSAVSYDSAGSSLIVTFNGNGYWYVNIQEFARY